MVFIVGVEVLMVMHVIIACGAIVGVVLLILLLRSEEHTSELQSPLIISYAVFCLKKEKVAYASVQCTGKG